MRFFWIATLSLGLGMAAAAQSARTEAPSGGLGARRGSLGLDLDPAERAYFAALDRALVERDKAQAELFNGRPRTAIRRLQTMFARRWPEGFDPREVTAYTQARTLAHLGDYAGARRWLHIDVHEFGDSCGVFQAARERDARILARVWEAAQRPKPEALKELEKLSRGEVRFAAERDPTSEAYAREFAAAEAKLILGQRLLREDHRAQGTALLREVTESKRGDYEFHAPLAKSLLR